MMSQTSKRELLAAVRPRYTLGNRTAKRRVLDELVATTGYQRKYAIQYGGGLESFSWCFVTVQPRAIYDVLHDSYGIMVAGRSKATHTTGIYDSSGRLINHLKGEHESQDNSFAR